MLVNIKVTGGLNIESGQIDPKATQELNLLDGVSWAKEEPVTFQSGNSR